MRTNDLRRFAVAALAALTLGASLAAQKNDKDAKKEADNGRPKLSLMITATETPRFFLISFCSRAADSSGW